MQPLMCALYRRRGAKHWLTTQQTFYATRAGLVHHMPNARTAEHKTTSKPAHKHQARLPGPSLPPVQWFVLFVLALAPFAAMKEKPDTVGVVCYTQN